MQEIQIRTQTRISKDPTPEGYVKIREERETIISNEASFRTNSDAGDPNKDSNKNTDGLNCKTFKCVTHQG